MKIIEIKPRRKALSGIRFDCEIIPSEYGAIEDAAGLLALDSELIALVCESHTKRAKSRAMWYLSRGDCSRKTLVDKLRRSFPE